MLYYAVATVVAFLLFGLFVYANPEPVAVYATRNGWYQELPVWIIALIGAVIGIALEFAFTRRIWHAQQQQLSATQKRLEKARTTVKELESSLKEREDELNALQETVGLEEGAEAAGVEARDDEAPI